jgi:cyclin D3
MAFATLFDSLYCPEEHLDLFHDTAADDDLHLALPLHHPPPPPPLLADDLPALFHALRGKEDPLRPAADDDGYGGVSAREAAVGWALRAVARLGFSALTAALAVAYLDRCFLGGALRLGDRPWMARLAAVACVALAAKVEETRVPVLLDLQLCAAERADPNEAYVFEDKTVRRMELLVLSALGWRMHPVTPLSYLQPLLGTAHAARLHHCDTALLALMPGGSSLSSSTTKPPHFSQKDSMFYLVSVGACRLEVASPPPFGVGRRGVARDGRMVRRRRRRRRRAPSPHRCPQGQ